MCPHSSQNVNNHTYMCLSVAGSFFRIDTRRRKYLIQFVIRAVSRETCVTWLNVTWPRATMSIEKDITHRIIWRPRANQRAARTEREAFACVLRRYTRSRFNLILSLHGRWPRQDSVAVRCGELIRHASLLHCSVYTIYAVLPYWLYGPKTFRGEYLWAKTPLHAVRWTWKRRRHYHGPVETSDSWHFYDSHLLQ